MQPERVRESDWKAFRKLREVALERFCERTLAEAAAICGREASDYHAQYLELFDHLGGRNEEMAPAFDNPRRSAMLQQLLSIVELELVDEAELAPFSKSVRETLRQWSKVGGG